MKSLESIYNSILLENQNTTNNIDIKLLKSCITGTYTINDDESIDVKGSVDLSQMNLPKIPFKFRNVSGNFYCGDNKIKNLYGSPVSVGGEFSCSYSHHLISLDGAPDNISCDFYCCYCSKLPYSELFKIVDRVKDNIYYSSYQVPEDKDKIRRDRDVKTILKDDELGNLDV